MSVRLISFKGVFLGLLVLCSNVFFAQDAQTALFMDLARNTRG